MSDAMLSLLSLQSGVISRRQIHECGLTAHDLKRLERRRDLTRVHPGVFVNHTGTLTWLARAWAAVLYAWPAALTHDSAIRATDGPGLRGRDDAVIQVAVDRHRRLNVPSGIRLHRLADFDAKVQWNTSPPRVVFEQAVLDVAGELPSELDAIATLADAIGSRRTRADRLLRALDQRQRIRRREFMRAVLLDVDSGACSVLEHGFLTRVERPHGLPTGDRQVKASSRGPIYRDVVYEKYKQVVELDGRLHTAVMKTRDDDLERDLEAALDGLATVRLGWGQVFGTTCLTAARLGRLLAARGWDQVVTQCPTCPAELAA